VRQEPGRGGGLGTRLVWVTALLFGGGLLPPGCGGMPPAQAGGAGGQQCLPTGWVDRIEGTYAVVVTDSEDELVLPVRCFPEPVRAGMRVVSGWIDWGETRKLRSELDAILGRLKGKRN